MYNAISSRHKKKKKKINQIIMNFNKISFFLFLTSLHNFLLIHEKLFCVISLPCSSCVKDFRAAVYNTAETHNSQWLSSNMFVSGIQ